MKGIENNNERIVKRQTIYNQIFLKSEPWGSIPWGAGPRGLSEDKTRSYTCLRLS